MSDAVVSPVTTRSAAALRLLVLRCVAMAWSILVPPLLYRGAMAFGGIRAVALLMGEGWILLNAVEIALVWGLLREVGEHAGRPLLQASLGLSATRVVVGAAGLLTSFVGPLAPVGNLAASLATAVGLAFDVTLWFALERLLAAPASVGLRLAFFATRLTSAAIIFLQLLAMAAYRELVRGPLGEALPWVHALLILVYEGAFVAVLAALWRRAPAAGSTGGQVLAAPPDGNSDLVVGAAWLVGGLLVTGVSYSMASAGGGRYLVTTGAIVYGLMRIGRGVVRNSRS